MDTLSGGDAASTASGLVDDPVADLLPITQERDIVAEMHAMAQDARRAMYLRRGDTGQVVRSEAEYAACVARNVPLSFVSRGKAQSIVAGVDARRAEARRRRSRRKAGRAARKGR